MAAVDDKFDFTDDDGHVSSANDANEELKRLAATRAQEHFDRIERRALEIRQEIDRRLHEYVLMAIDIDNWIGLLRSLKQGVK